MLQDWKPSFRIESHCLLPVEIRKQRFLICARSALVMNPAPLGCSMLACSPMAEDECLSHQTLLDSFLDLLNLDLRETADLEKVLAVLCMNSLLR